ncbi:ATP-binding protein [Clostridium arbusti]|uniref:ATP-binding protein n=1 Tax=Clostridium arbusti TaxID=1137848 RepID=UPI000288F604|nr:ATP-binding protein [Clostridium arbusti]
MLAMKKILEKSQNPNLDSPCKDINNIPKCSVCTEPIGIAVTTCFGTRVYPRSCKCRRNALEAQRLKDKNMEKQIRLKQVISNSLMNDKFRKCTLRNWNHSVGNKNLYKVANQYINKFSNMKAENKGILIHGTPGNGKTYFSACIANALMERLVPVICVGAIGLTERIAQSKRTWGNEGIFTVLNSLENADLLVIDDLGTEEDTKWTRAMIYQIIEKRNVINLPLIVTTNMSLEELKERYDDRTYSRLLGMCSFINNTGKDIRKIQGKEKSQKFLQELLNS